MKVLMVSLPPIGKWDGGVPRYTYDLSEGLLQLGHKIIYLYNWGADLKLKPYLRKEEKGGITFLELRNSPVYHVNLHNIKLDVTNAKVEKLFLKIIEDYKPDLVHIQSIMGFPFRIVEIAHLCGIPIINSLHSYFYICPTGALFSGRGRCDGLNVFKCVYCIKLWGSTLLRSKFKIFFPRFFVEIAGSIKDRFFDSNIKNHRSQFKNEWTTELSLSRVHELQLRSEYSKYVLGECVNLNIAVSSRVKHIFTEHGYLKDNIRVVHVGTRAAEFIKPMDFSKTGPKIRFGYMGPIAPRKGIHVAVEAFRKLKNDNISLNIYGPTDSMYAQRLKESVKGDKRISFNGRYEWENLSNILGSFDVMIIPPIWEDNAPQIVFESLAAKKPIIGANIGGIPDFIQHQVNGLLFDPGNSDDLSKKIIQIVNDPGLIYEFRNNIKKVKTMREHVDEIGRLYEETNRNVEGTFTLGA